MSRPGGSAISPHSPDDALIWAIIPDYETAWTICHKLRVALIEDIDKLGRCLVEWPLPTQSRLWPWSRIQEFRNKPRFDEMGHMRLGDA
jgi:hypothetical protein